MEGITVDGGGGLSVGAGEEKVRGGVLVLQCFVLQLKNIVAFQA